MPTVVLTTPGTPQSLAGVQTPAQPTITIQGVTSSIGGAQQPSQVVLQADPSNAGNIYVGRNKAMTRTPRAGIDNILTPGQTVTYGNSGASVPLDTIWLDTDMPNNAVLVRTQG